MDLLNCDKLTEDEFVERFLNDVDTSMNDIEYIEMENIGTSVNNNATNIVENKEPETSKNGKVKRRSNLTEFNSSHTAKRKNESAKRELTSIVKQLGKIDKQLNTKANSRVSINFFATFTSFNSNRQSTFMYPPDAKIKQTLLDHDVTILAVKNAVKDSVKEVLNDVAKEKRGIECVTDPSLSSNITEVLATPTKTISAFTALPSPVTVKGQPVSAKNLCTKNSCTFGRKTRKPVWIKCSYRKDDEQQCSYWVHAPCIGFPSLKADDVKILNGWFCPDHTDMQMKRK